MEEPFEFSCILLLVSGFWKGIRTRKYVDNVLTTYYLSGSNIIQMKEGNNSPIWFTYDVDGTRIGLEYGANKYYYLYNLQGDVIQIIDASGNTVVTYSYDAWGRIISTTDTSGCNLASKNPFRYRGYYYDEETGLYYVNSRYYDPEIGRFINADGAVSTGQGFMGYNMYAYCLNNPETFIDTVGCGAVFLTAPRGASGAGHTSLLIQDENGKWWYLHYDNTDKGKVRMEETPDDVAAQIFDDGTVNFDPLNMWLKENDIYAQDENYEYEDCAYINGDFSDSVKYALGLQNKSPKYKVWGNNCANMCIDVLLKGKGLSKSQRDATEITRNALIIPNLWKIAWYSLSMSSIINENRRVLA